MFFRGEARKEREGLVLSLQFNLEAQSREGNGCVSPVSRKAKEKTAEVLEESPGAASVPHPQPVRDALTSAD